MKLRLLPFLLAAAVVGSGCIVQHDASGLGDSLNPSDNGSYGNGYYNITFAWSFDGLSCSDVSISNVVVSMPGQTLQNGGSYPCSSGSLDGITLENFVPGTYPYSIQAYNVAGELAYAGQGQIQIDGQSHVEYVVLNRAHDGTDGGTGGEVDGGSGGTVDGGSGTPADGGSSGGTDGGSGGGSGTYRYYLSWTFPDVPNAPVCGGEMTHVVLTIDGQPTSYDCTAGLSPAQIVTPPLALGNHTLQFDAEGADGTVWASTQTTLNVTCGCHPSQSFQLNWVVGSAAVDWIFFDSSHQNPTTRCDTAQVDTMDANFQAGDGSWLFKDAQGNQSNDSFSCADSGGVAVYRALPPGSYSVYLDGQSSCANYSEYPGQACYQATVQAGVFYSRDSYADGVVSIDLDQQ